MLILAASWLDAVVNLGHQTCVPGSARAELEDAGAQPRYASNVG